MCGIAGILDISKHRTNDSLRRNINRMTSSLIHRGPDDCGMWIDVESGIAFGHKRLSIIDLSSEGHQPMFSSSGRYIITFNGEIYNYQTIRNVLINKGYIFRGCSDTEVILASIEEWGLENAVKRFVGMFAVGLWDAITQKLYLVRDRIGEKPLYYGWMGQTFLFSSELKALYAHSEFSPDINREAICSYLRYCYIPGPYSIYKGIYKLPPGSILTLSPDEAGLYPNAIPYWSALDAVGDGMSNRFTGTDEEAVIQLEGTLREAISLQMISDVPLGAFLSGGVDSSLIVALMQTQSQRPVKTFTIGMYDNKYNEAKDAKAVAEYLRTDHTELYIDPKKAMSVVPKLPELYDEPFGDSSQIPTFLVAEMTRQNVTVSLTGDAGDELFGGYNRYFWGMDIWNKIGWMPSILRNTAASGIMTISPTAWDKFFMTLEPVLPMSLKQRMPGDRIHKLAEILSVNSPEEMYHRLVSCWKNPQTIIHNSSEPDMDNSSWYNKTGSLTNFTEFMMFMDLITYLPDDILVKVDRACMGVSLESRVPFLDHHVIEFAWRLPLSMKIRQGQGKWLLRQLLYKYVPRELIERPKMGFGVPIDSWLRGPLKSWAEHLLNDEKLSKEGFFKLEEVKRKWNEHQSGKRNWQYHLWNILMFQSWYDRWINKVK